MTYHLFDTLPALVFVKVTVSSTPAVTLQDINDAETDAHVGIGLIPLIPSSNEKATLKNRLLTKKVRWKKVVFIIRQI